jgi:hypothetical protein
MKAGIIDVVHFTGTYLGFLIPRRLCDLADDVDTSSGIVAECHTLVEVGVDPATLYRTFLESLRRVVEENPDLVDIVCGSRGRPCHA